MTAAPASLKAAKLLLVDDDATRRNVRSIVLTTHGYDVNAAADLGEAEKICRTARPDLLLIGGQDTPATYQSLRRFGVAHPAQRVGFLLNEGHRLCAVTFNGTPFLPPEESDDFVSRVACLLSHRAHRKHAAALRAAAGGD